VVKSIADFMQIISFAATLWLLDPANSTNFKINSEDFLHDQFLSYSFSHLIILVTPLYVLNIFYVEASGLRDFCLTAHMSGFLEYLVPV
jgi:hypothetical protein